MSERYAAQGQIAGWGEAAQQRLREAHVFVVGAGARGCVVAGLLAAAGAGKLSVVDGSQVALESLTRQLLHFTPDVNANRAESVRAKLALQNPDAHVDAFPADVDAQNVAMILQGASCVVDCANDFSVSRLINDHCVEAGVPYVFGATDGWNGALLSVGAKAPNCLRCVEQVANSAALGPVAATIGSLQALEAMKFVGGVGEPRESALLRLTGDDLSIATEPLTCSPDCICARG
ncbi:MAG: HesA/MoeB/ThiF family protein [Solirubrobacterales bacterium]